MIPDGLIVSMVICYSLMWFLFNFFPWLLYRSSMQTEKTICVHMFTYRKWWNTNGPRNQSLITLKASFSNYSHNEYHKITMFLDTSYRKIIFIFESIDNHRIKTNMVILCTFRRDLNIIIRSEMMYYQLERKQ